MLVPTFLFAVLLADWACPLAMVSIIMLGVQVISVVAPFARWHWFVTQTWNFHFLLTAMRLCIVVWPTANYLHMFELFIKSLHQDVLDGRVLSLELWIVSRWTCFLYADVGLSPLNHILISLIWNLVILPLSEPSTVVWWYSAFLLNLLKVDGIASPHSPCTIPYALWLHQIISINTQVHLSLEQECRYPIPPWVYPW
jgi:hypothetical protein